MTTLIATLALAFQQAAAAPDPLILNLPVDCEMGADCFVQNYFDHGPDGARADYMCGRLSYDGHDGTDFRASTLQRMEAGVPVIAAAAGVVTAARDGEPDISVRERGREAVTGREGGNGVALNHGGGWTTQYSHLKRDSVQVAPGDLVESGDVLGEIGMSGLTEFPHVHFLVRYQGRPVDPYVGWPGAYECGTARRPLWSKEAGAVLDYRSTGLLAAGFAGRAPNAHDARAGLYDETEIAPSDPLVFWVDGFGALAGDDQAFRIEGPQGVILDSRSMLETSGVSLFAFTGEQAPEGGWPAGEYRARYRLIRGDETLIEHEATLQISAPAANVHAGGPETPPGQD